MPQKNRLKVGAGADPSRRKVLAPAPASSDALAYGQQLQNLLMGFNQTRSGIMKSSGDLKANYANQVEQIRQEGVQQLAGVENQALGSGQFGGSADVQRRLMVQGNVSAALREAANALTAGLSANRNALQQAQQGYDTARAGLDASINGFPGGLLQAPGGRGRNQGGAGGGQGNGQKNDQHSDGILAGLEPSMAQSVRTFANWGPGQVPETLPPNIVRAVRQFVNQDPQTAEEYFTGIWKSRDAIPRWLDEALREAKMMKVARVLAGYF
jgi:hypothetical protein